jgi:hypothetical protein
MSENKLTPHSAEVPNNGKEHNAHGPYWKRAHRDWRIWVFVILMIGCMLIYIITGDLRWPLPGHAQPMISPAP